MNNNLRNLAILSSLLIFLYSCGMGADARQFPPDAESRVKKNIEEGRGFRLFEDEIKEAQVTLILQAPTVCGELHLIRLISCL